MKIKVEWGCLKLICTYSKLRIVSGIEWVYIDVDHKYDIPIISLILEKVNNLLKIF